VSEKLKLFALAALCPFIASAAHAASLDVPVTIHASGVAAKLPLKGRMLLFIQSAHGKQPPRAVTPGFVASAVDIVGFDVDQGAGTAVMVPADAVEFPQRLNVLKPGIYDVQALLDVNHMYSYDGVTDGDLLGPVQRVRVAPGTPLSLQLTQRYDEPAPKSTADVRIFEMVSPSLSKFYGKTTRVRATVILPIGYDPHKKYPVVYHLTGYGGTYASGFRLTRLRKMMSDDGVHAVLVVADSSGPTGIAEFADSANNGPWGHAFTSEFIPAIERAYPIDGRPSRRFLWGHSSGGWATLWLQITYPRLFGGTWSSSPDPVDFHDFTGPDLVENPPDDMYFNPWGHPWQLVRMGTTNVMTLREFVLLSDAEGFRASQFGSFDAVFSPRGADGDPEPLFDHRTGKIDPAVAGYWEAHYDIAAKIERNWPALASTVARKVHIAVGTLDTFHLERGVLRLDARIRRLGVTPDITYFKDASHFSLFQETTNYEGFHWAFRGIAAASQEPASPRQ
jgi:hypothetical protein